MQSLDESPGWHSHAMGVTLIMRPLPHPQQAWVHVPDRLMCWQLAPSMQASAEGLRIDPNHTHEVGARAQAVIMASLRHPNIILFMGICLEPPCLVTEWCSRGSLYDVIARAARKDPKSPPLDWIRSLSMALDAAKVRVGLGSGFRVRFQVPVPAAAHRQAAAFF